LHSTAIYPPSFSVQDSPQCCVIDIAAYFQGSFHHVAAWVPTIAR